jgi:hypothetical protein
MKPVIGTTDGTIVMLDYEPLGCSFDDDDDDNDNEDGQNASWCCKLDMSISVPLKC